VNTLHGSTERNFDLDSIFGCLGRGLHTRRDLEARVHLNLDFMAIPLTRVSCANGHKDIGRPWLPDELISEGGDTALSVWLPRCVRYSSQDVCTEPFSEISFDWASYSKLTVPYSKLACDRV